MNLSNVVLVTVDCFRYDRCGFDGHGRNTTPVLDELATESYIFDKAYATGPYTTESVPGILAGQHSYNGVHYGDHLAWKALPSECETIATYLSEHGYQTTATLTNPHLTRERNFDRGFQQFRNLRTGTGEETGESGSPGLLDRFDLSDAISGLRPRMREYETLVNPYTIPYVAYRYYQSRTDWPTVRGEDVVRELVSDLGGSSEPFFAWTHLMDLHAPINPRSARRGGLAAGDGTVSHLLTDASRVSLVHEPKYDAMYDSALRYVDECIGRLVAELRSRGCWDETVLVVTGDHGEVLFDRDGIYGHPRHHLYDELLHVPLLVRTPGDGRGRIDQPFSLAWLHELLSETLGVERGEFPAESGRKWTLPEPDGEPSVIVSDSLDGNGHSLAVRDGENKLIHHENARTMDANFSEYEYIDHDVAYRYDADVGERVPFAPETSPELRSIAHRLSARPDDHPTIEGEFRPEIEQRLQDLGYRM